MTNKEENKELQTENSISIFKKDDTQKKFQELLGKRASGFLTTVMSIVAQNDMLRNADPNSVYLSALVSATLDLPINPNLGFAYILPYTSNVKTGTYDQQGKEILVKKTVAQFQMGYKGFIQLALRSGQFKTISATPVYEGQIVSQNPLTGYEFDWTKKDSDKIVGYASYFSLLNGFEKTLYMTVEELEAHGKNFSQTYKKGYGLWKDDFDAMALKGLSIETLIPTKNGRKKMGEIVKGDIVFDKEGKETNVIAVSDVKNIGCYEIEFSNGEKVICDEEHIWNVRVNSKTYMEKGKLYPKRENRNITEMIGYKKISVPVPECVEYERKELPIDPWLLGYWIGNGSSSNSNVSCDKKDAEELSKKISSLGYDTNIAYDSRNNSASIKISRIEKSHRNGGLREQLDGLGVLKNKHIPEIYKFSSKEQRVELIKGLFDSDGCIDDKRGRISFGQIRCDIVDGVYDILCSLGEIPNRLEGIRYGFGSSCYYYEIQLQPKNNLFSLKRKSDRFKNRKVRTYRGIKSIKEINSVPTICIGVDSPSKTYLCSSSYIPTHNTTLKLLLSKFAPLSVEMQTAVITDQGIIKNEEMEVEYIDNPPLSESTTEISEDKMNYYKGLIDDCNTTLEVNELVTQNNWKDETILLYVQAKKDALAKI